MKAQRISRDWEISEGVVEDGGMPPSSTTRARPELHSVPDSEVKAQRRLFSTSYKRQILRAAQTCQGRGELVALLRREGLYFSHLSKWRQQERSGTLDGMRGRKPDSDTALKLRIAQLERENERLQGRLRQAAKIIEVQKKVSEILGVSLETSDSDKSD